MIEIKQGAYGAYIIVRGRGIKSGRGESDYVPIWKQVTVSQRYLSQIIDLNFETAHALNGPRIYTVPEVNYWYPTIWHVRAITYEGSEGDCSGSVTLLQVFDRFKLGWLLECVKCAWWMQVGTVKGEHIIYSRGKHITIPGVRAKILAIGCVEEDEGAYAYADGDRLFIVRISLVMHEDSEWVSLRVGSRKRTFGKHTKPALCALE